MLDLMIYLQSQCEEFKTGILFRGKENQRFVVYPCDDSKSMTSPNTVTRWSVKKSLIKCVAISSSFSANKIWTRET